MALSAVLSGIAAHRIFIACVIVPKPEQPGKTDKVPCNAAGENITPHDPGNWLTLAEAESVAACAFAALGGQYRTAVGVVIYEGSGLFCVDVDGALHDGQWSPLALDIVGRFPGAYVEVSQSGKGLHVMGRIAPDFPKHRVKKKGLALEVYTRGRFILVTGTSALGDIQTDHTAAVTDLIRAYLPEPLIDADADGWTSGPYPGWRGGGTDEQIIHNQMQRRGAHAAFGGGAAFADLWTANERALARAFPSTTADTFDRSGADQALANHLAYATGYDCERTLALMWKSGLRREKWEREGYLRTTILKAVAGKIPEGVEPSQASPTAPAVDGTVSVPPPPPPPLGEAFVVPPPPPPVVSAAAPIPTGTTAGAAPPPPSPTDWPPPPGSYLSAEEQARLFAGCIYIQDMHQILQPNGVTLEKKQFDAEHGGYDFQMRVDGQKPSTSAWDCFIDSQITRYPRAHGLVFDPKLSPHQAIVKDGLTFINSWVPVDILKTKGDATPFLQHMRNLLPNERDYSILLAYMAAVVQYPGTKFQWCPLIQGVEGNGKTLLSTALEYAVGERYTHWPRAKLLGKQFNAGFFGKLLVCVEDVHISEAKGELWEELKPMITGQKIEIEYKGVDVKTPRANTFNFLLNSNHRDAIRKTRNDRRIAPFFCAQQSAHDLIRMGMGEDYFNALHRWLKSGGYAIVAEYLATYPIPDELNPATQCVRAPSTSSTEEAIRAGRGSIEQELAEAIEEGRAGFRGGWVNSMAFDDLLAQLGKARQIKRDLRGAMIESMGYQRHPGLPDGRVVSPLTDGTRPRLYVPVAGHPSLAPGLRPSDIAQQYIAAQAPPK
jgi:hypothetical protein